MATETEFAPAKVNLTLHVTGRRQDGYHLLDSLVVFAGVGDRVSVTAGEGFSVTGPQAALLPPSDDNLCLRAARAMGGGVAITLDKVLPVASGIGGGSADAAATLRALARMGRALPDAETVLKLGADVPVCLSGHAVRMTGVGEGLAPVSVPSGWMVLVNPGVAVSTPSVFRALDRRENPPMPTPLPPLPDMAALVAFVASQRNDLEAPAIVLAPVIADVKAALAAQDGCLLARMSGSGATCFGLFAGQASAEAAAGAIRAAQPGWWAAAAPMQG
ncbi:4-(cytidine 5'-diphospho)-2-C-methyl-D-erythritol kinase [Fuscovulum blasticum]|uniref:4-(cytidine 5'-diphospho)-2-C-methyl-D-erythritol kinase n=1 Tax=Fuscovulum blasticum TaxID=1075 RepID=UPI000D3E9647|nr:4-(cytidine 5'-diphospho)-2-C-methyl-D-erythritol kinase [Fuscovulum blasticum]AWD22048.1 4-(cytidine 5'-diphospho)-2-C-methyl-D-erythritol kinase [Fuscovulum blasticum]